MTVKGVSGSSQEIDLFSITVVAKKRILSYTLISEVLESILWFLLATKIMIQKLDCDALLSVLASLCLISAHLL